MNACVQIARDHGLPRAELDVRRHNEGSGLTSTPFRASAQDGLSAVHSQIRFGEDDPGFAVIDIFRFEEEKLVEHGGVLQPVVVDTVGGHSVFDGGGMNLGSFDSETSDEEEAARKGTPTAVGGKGPR